MTSHDTKKRIQKFLENDENEYLKRVFLDTSKWFLELTRAENSFVIRRAHADADKDVLNKISAIDNELKAWAKGKLFRQIDKFIVSIKDLQMLAVNAQFAESPVGEDFSNAEVSKYSQVYAMDFNLELVQQFETAYEDFLVAPNVLSIYQVLELGHSIHLQLTAVSFTLWDVRDQLDQNDGEPIAENELELEIWLNGSDKLHIIVAKLNALNGAYVELCHLLNISAEEYPLRVGKLETGSLWLKVFGYNRVITLLVDGLTEATKYLHRTFSRDGKFYSTKDQAKTLESLVDLQPKLEALGIDTSDMKTTIGKSATLIAKNQLEFLSGESKVVLNDTSFAYTPPVDFPKTTYFTTNFGLNDKVVPETKLLKGGDPESNQ